MNEAVESNEIVFSLWMYPLLFLFGLTGGFVDSVAGGGGLITVPLLMSLGLPPQLALGTNKFQASFGSFSASVHYIRKGKAQLSEAIYGIVFTAVGAGFGAFLVQQVDAGSLSKVIPFLLTAILFYIVFSPDLGKIDKHPRMGIRLFFLIFGLAIGFYDGFFGPGTGSFWVVFIMIFLGHNMVKATAYTKIMNFTSNIISLIVFVVGGNVLFKAGLIMAAGQFIGARIGSGIVVKKGTKFIKPVFITVVVCIISTLYYQNYTD